MPATAASEPGTAAKGSVLARARNSRSWAAGIARRADMTAKGFLKWIQGRRPAGSIIFRIDDAAAAQDQDFGDGGPLFVLDLTVQGAVRGGCGHFPQQHEPYPPRSTGGIARPHPRSGTDRRTAHRYSCRSA